MASDLRRKVPEFCLCYRPDVERRLFFSYLHRFRAPRYNLDRGALVQVRLQVDRLVLQKLVVGCLSKQKDPFALVIAERWLLMQSL